MKYQSNIESGFGRGKGLGFPTYNVVIPAELSAAPGVYAAWVWIAGRRYKSAAHFGPVPTFGHTEPTLEFHLLEYYEGDEVTELEFELVHYLRPILTFESPEQLSIQIAQDVKDTEQALTIRSEEHQ